MQQKSGWGLFWPLAVVIIVVMVIAWNAVGDT